MGIRIPVYGSGRPSGCSPSKHAPTARCDSTSSSPSPAGVHFDALKRIWEELNSKGEAIPSPLVKWFRGFDSGRRRRPRERPIPKHRPVTLAKFLSDFNIQLTIEILGRVGISPEGEVSGCHIVSDALATSEDPALRLAPETVTGIWQERIWGSAIESVMGKYSKAIEERHGPFRA